MPEQICDLIEKLRHGDKDAFGVISEKYAPLICTLMAKYCSFISENDVEYDDIHQEALIALYNAALSYDMSQSDVSFGLYAKICIGNRIISVIRKIVSTDRHSTDIPYDILELQLEDNESDPSKQFDDKESARLLAEKILSLLSEYERSVFEKYLQDVSVTDIATALGKTPKSVDNALVRIKNKLRRLL